MDASPTAQPRDLASGGICACCGDNDTTNNSPPPLSNQVVENNCCSGDEIKQGRCCSGSDKNANEDSCNGNKCSLVGDEKDGCGGCCGGLDAVSSLPVVDRRGCCSGNDKKANEDSCNGNKDSDIRVEKDGCGGGCCGELDAICSLPVVDRRGCCSGSDKKVNEDSRNANKCSDIGNEKDGCGGCCGGLAAVSSLPVVDRRGCCSGSDKTANNDCCNGNKASDVGDKKDGFGGGCCGGLDAVSSLPVVDRRGCCSGSDRKTTNEKSCNGDKGSDVGGEKDSCDGCCGELDTVSSLPVVDRRGCCSGSNNKNGKEDSCNTNKGSDIGNEKDGCGGCCVGMDSVSSLPVLDPQGCCDKEASQDQELESRDESACPCCIEVLVREAFSQSSSSFESSSFQVNDVVESTVCGYDSLTPTLRACCKILKKHAPSACCFAPELAALKAPSHCPPSKEQDKDGPNQLHKGNTLESTDLMKPTSVQEKLQLEVRGMDCVNCTPKIARALAQLPSVNNTSIDWFSGIVELRYDPEIIAPPAIAAYVARATGFGVRPKINASDDGATSTITLPLLFATIPPSETFDGFDTHVGSNPNIIEVSFSIHQDSDRRPRDVIEHFKPFGVQLLPSRFGNERDNATYDFINIGLRTIGCAFLSIPVLVIAWAKLPPRPVLYGAISIALCTGIQTLAFSLLSHALRSILYLREIDLSVLVAFTTLIAYLFSVIAYACEVAGKPFSAPFFETIALLITLIMLGRTIAAATRRSTRSALRELEKLQPNDVLLVPREKEAAQPQSLDARLLHYGDIIRVLPESIIATDGLVIGGSSDVDESSVTGESVALTKQKGNCVLAGTLNLSGTLEVQVTRLVHENSLSHITTLVKQAQLSHSPVQDLADKLSAWILPAASVAACMAFLVWILVGLYVHNLSRTSSAVQALTYVIAVFVVSCPCAIGLAVPMVVASAIRVAVREGVLFRSPDALHTTTDITTIVFDKTGTLTQGTFTVGWVQIVVEGAEHLVKSLVEDNKHPIAQGVHRYLCANPSPTKNLTQGLLSDITTHPGKGIKASLRGFPLMGGNPTFTGTCEHPTVLELSSSGLSLFTVTLAGQPIAFFGLADTPRPEVGPLIAELVQRGKQVMIMSGDTPSAVHRLADIVGVPSSNVFAAHTPEDKDTAIVAMQAQGQRVCFVGDGTNDAPALSHADVSLAIAAGSDVALAAADAVLLGSDLKRGVLALLDIATAARVHARWALGWCVFYNVFAILLAAGAFVKVRIEPRWAGIGEIVSVVPVVTIGFLLDWRWKWARKVVRR